MSGGHDHGTGHGDGHAAGSAAPHDGPHEIPPMPEHPFISPARAEYELPWPGRILLWPPVWAAFAILCYVAARTWDHAPLQGEHGHAAGPEGAGEHGTAPHESGPPKPGLPSEVPAMGEHSR